MVWHGMERSTPQVKKQKQEQTKLIHIVSEIRSAFVIYQKFHLLLLFKKWLFNCWVIVNIANIKRRFGEKLQKKMKIL